MGLSEPFYQYDYVEAFANDTALITEAFCSLNIGNFTWQLNETVNFMMSCFGQSYVQYKLPKKKDTDPPLTSSDLAYSTVFNYNSIEFLENGTMILEDAECSDGNQTFYSENKIIVNDIMNCFGDQYVKAYQEDEKLSNKKLSGAIKVQQPQWYVVLLMVCLVLSITW